MTDEEYRLWEAERKINKIIQENDLAHMRGKIDFIEYYDRDRELKKIRRDIRGY